MINAFTPSRHFSSETPRCLTLRKGNLGPAHDIWNHVAAFHSNPFILQ